MALTGILGADFSAFLTAVDQADIKLRGFEGSGSKVESALTRMTNSFTGQKIISEATLMAEAFQRLTTQGIGLTEAELKKMGATADEAIEKLKAIGRDVPPGIKAIADAAKAAEPPVSLLSSAVSNLVAGVGIGTLLHMATEAFTFASSMQDLSERTNISAEALQRFEVIARENGSTVDAVAVAVFQMGKRLAGDDASAEAAVKKLGLSFEDLKRLQPAEAFQVLGTAIGDLQDPMQRSQVAAAIFGKSVDDLIPTLRHLKEETGFHIKASNDQIAAFDALGDAAGRQLGSWKPLLITWVDAHINLTGLTKAIEEFHAAMGETGLAGALTAVKPPILAVGESLKPVQLEMEIATRRSHELAESAEKELAAAERHAAEEAQKLEQALQSVSRIENSATVNRLEALASWSRYGEQVQAAAHILDEKYIKSLADADLATKALAKTLYDEAVAQDKVNATLGATSTQTEHLTTTTDQGSEAMKRMTQVATGLSASLANVQAAAEAAFDAAAKINTSPFSGAFAGAVQAGSFGSPTPGISYFKGSGLQSFDEGGPVNQTGPILAHAGEFVLPRGGGAGVTIINHNYIAQPLGTPREISRAIGEATMSSYRGGGGRLPVVR